MKIHIHFENAGASQTHVFVAVDGTECGSLAMATEDAARFAEIMKLGCSQFQTEFTSSGKLRLPEDWVLWHTRSGRERREEEDRRTGQERRARKNRRSGEDPRAKKT